MTLSLKNSLVIFDLETTGMDIVHDRIVELSYLKIFPDGQEDTRTYRVNPTVPIPEEVTAIHGIRDEDVKDAPTFGELAGTLVNVFEGCDIAGYGSNKFDLPLLAEEFLRADVEFDLKKHKFIDVQVIFHKREQRTLSAAYRFYCGKELINAHSAEVDARATYEVLQSQLDMYDDLPNDIEQLSEYSAHTKAVDFAGRIILNDKDEEIFNFGKHKGRKITDVLEKDPAFYAWMMNSDFPQYTKNVFTHLKLQHSNKK